MKNLHIWLLVALVIAGGAFMACSKKKKSDNNQPTATKSSSATQVSDATKVSGTTPSASDGGAPSLDDLAGLAATKEGKVVYSYSSSDATDTIGSFTIYSKPPNSRFDVEESGVVTTIINSGGKTYLCSADSQSCFESPTAIPLPFISFFTDPSTIAGLIGADAGNADHSSKTVAGMDADCYSASTSGGSGEVCFSSGGLLLSIHGTDSSTGTGFTLEATSAEDTVSDADLEPPYPITSLGG